MTPEEEAERIAQAYRDYPHEALVRACVRMKAEIRIMAREHNKMVEELRNLKYVMQTLINTIDLNDQVDDLLEEISKES